MYVVQEDCQAFAGKLGIKLGFSVLLLNAPDVFSKALKDSNPPSAQIYESLRHENKPDVVLWWPLDDVHVKENVKSLRHHIKEDGVLWVVIPKKPAAKIRGVNLNYTDVVAEALKTGLVDNKTLTFSPEEYGIRFVVRLSERSF